MNDKEQNSQKNTVADDQKKQPAANETAGFYMSSSIKITDPATGQTILHKRADD